MSTVSAGYCCRLRVARFGGTPELHAGPEVGLRIRTSTSTHLLVALPDHPRGRGAETTPHHVAPGGACDEGLPGERGGGGGGRCPSHTHAPADLGQTTERVAGPPHLDPHQKHN